MFEKFTDSARMAIVHAQEEARSLQHPVIASEHLLLGVLADASPTADLLARHGIRSADARAAVIARRPTAGRGDAQGHIPFTPNAKRVMELAVGAADGAAVGPDALVVGLLGRDCGALQVVRSLGADPDAVDAAARAAMQLSSRPVAGARPASPPGEQVATSVRRLAAERDRLHRALQRYGCHDDTCPGAGGCTCGLQTELDADG